MEGCFYSTAAITPDLTQSRSIYFLVYAALLDALLRGKLMPYYTISTATVPEPSPDEKCARFHLN